ncbi:MAG: cation transporter [Chloroflexi bacterium]|nr:MAG: cation transporter [Chloroflexota bacterium]TMB94265.1 MAG: cation transporter [Chloroflexota bacterium]TMC25167.1 MAG: cation transporter [Chloroflexota bacterium]TMC34773.1 MAG: cation transporter [Chloroflexota bacterium]TMC54495.1 MAG: cation transporter [Chloroflexota bacterium]
MSGHGRSAAQASRSRLVLVLGISAAVFVAEIVTGILTNSLALLADSAHVFTDMTGVVLALAAIELAGRPATDRRSYGYHRLEIFAAIVNALLLFGIAAVVLIEGVRRISADPSIQTGPMVIVAGLAFVANLAAASVLRGPAATSLNMKGAYLEVMSDALGSAAVLIAGGTIVLTGFRAADVIASLLIGALILPRTWSLLREAVDILLEATPKTVHVAHVREHILDAPGVTGVHDLHVWTITSGMNVISAHVEVTEHADRGAVLRELARCLSDDFDIEHSTFQVEGPDHKRFEGDLHA